MVGIDLRRKNLFRRRQTPEEEANGKHRMRGWVEALSFNFVSYNEQRVRACRENSSNLSTSLLSRTNAPLNKMTGQKARIRVGRRYQVKLPKLRKRKRKASECCEQERIEFEQPLSFPKVCNWKTTGVKGITRNWDVGLFRTATGSRSRRSAAERSASAAGRGRRSNRTGKQSVTFGLEGEDITRVIDGPPPDLHGDLLCHRVQARRSGELRLQHRLQ